MGLPKKNQNSDISLTKDKTAAIPQKKNDTTNDKKSNWLQILLVFVLQLLPVIVMGLVGSLTAVTFTFEEWAENLIVITVVSSATCLFKNGKKKGGGILEYIMKLYRVGALCIGCVLHSLLLVCHDNSVAEFMQLHSGALLMIAVFSVVLTVIADIVEMDDGGTK